MASPKVKKDNVTQEINLKEVFGMSFKGREGLKVALGEELLKVIKERTKAGDGVVFDGSGNSRKKKLSPPAYSESYKKSPEFKAAGKTSKVNLTLSGDMLELMDIVKTTPEKITLGWKDELQKKKAYAHQVGRKKDPSVKVPARPFFGVTKKEIAKIRKKYANRIKKARSEAETKSDEDILKLIGQLGG